MTDKEKHEKCKVITKKISKILHEKMDLKKWELLPCRTMSTWIEICVYGNSDKKKKVVDILTEHCGLKTVETTKYNSFAKKDITWADYFIENISVNII